MIGLYTACNDRMLPFLPAWLGAKRVYNNDAKLFVIPFDDNVTELRAFCDKAAIPILWDTVQDWRQVGARIYGSAQYRPGILSASYFSKLAAFSGPLQRFVFSDVNSLLLFDVNRQFGDKQLRACQFMHEARRFRTVRNRAAFRLYRSISPGFRGGYNACFFLSERNFVSLGEAEEALMHKNYRADNFGPAPEQSLLSWLQVSLEKQCGLIRNIYPDVNTAPRRGVLAVNDGLVMDRHGKIIHFVKWTGPWYGQGMRHRSVADYFYRQYMAQGECAASAAPCLLDNALPLRTVSHTLAALTVSTPPPPRGARSSVARETTCHPCTTYVAVESSWDSDEQHKEWRSTMEEDVKASRKAARKAARASGEGTAARKSPRELTNKGKPEEAVIAQLRRIEKNPEQGTAYVRILPLLIKLKLPRLAVMVGQKALAAGVSNPGIYLWLARAKRAEGDLAGAMAAVSSGLASHPDNQQLQKLKARLDEAPLKQPTAR